MVYNKDNANLDWQRNLKPASQPIARGNQVLVSYTRKRNEAPVFKTSSTRCVWPTSILVSDSRVFSRRLTVKA